MKPRTHKKIHKFLASLLLLIFSGIFLALAEPETADQLVGEAEALFQNAKTSADYNLAIKKFIDAASLYKASGEETKEANCFTDIAYVYQKTLQPNLALQYYEEAESIYLRMKNRRALEYIYFQEGDIYQTLQQSSKSLENYDKAEAIASDNRDDRTRADIEGQKASELLSLRRPKEAMSNLIKAEQTCKTQGLTQQLAYVYFDEGWANDQMAQYNDALKHYGQAEAIFLQLNLPGQLALIYFDEGNDYKELSRYHEALDSYAKADKSYSGQGNEVALALVYTEEGTTYSKLSMYDDALKSFDKAEKIYTSKKMKDSLAMVYQGKGLVYAALLQLDKAQEYFKKAHALSPSSFSSPTTAASVRATRKASKDAEEETRLFSEAKSLLQSAKKPNDSLKAIKKVKAELKFCEKHRYYIAEAGICVLIATSLPKSPATAEWEEALTYLKRAENIFKKLGTPPGLGLAQIYEAEGAFYVQLHQSGKSLEYLGKALVIYNKTGAPPHTLAQIYEGKGYSYFFSSNYDKAIEWFTKAEEIFHSSGNDKDLASVCVPIALIYSWDLAQPKNALECLDKAKNIYSREALQVPLAQTYIWEAYSYQELADYPSAIRSLEQAQTIYKDKNLQDGLASVYLAQGRVYEDLIQYVKALGLLEKAAAYFRLHNSAMLASTYYEMGRTYENLSLHEPALRYLAKAETLDQKQKDPGALGQVCEQIGNLYLERSNYTQALKYYNDAEKFFKKEDMQYDLAGIYVLKSMPFGGGPKLLDAAQRIFERSMTSGGELISPLLATYNLKMFAFFLQGNYQQGFYYGRKALREFDALQREMFIAGTETSALAIESRYESTFELTALCAIKGNAPEQAFSTVESGKMRVFSAMLQRNSAILSTQDKDPAVKALWSQRVQDLQDISTLTLEAERVPDEQLRKTKLAEVKKLQDQLFQVEQELNLKSQAFAVVFGTKLTKVSDIQDVLHPDEEVLEYAFLQNELYLFIIDKNDFRVVRLLDAKQMNGFKGNLQRLTAAVANSFDGYIGGSGEFQQLVQQSYREYQALVIPVSNTLIGDGVILPNVRRLLIVPDKELSFLPFEMLQTRGHFLVEKYEISYLNMASELLHPKNPNGAGFLGYGGIDYTAGGPAYQQSLSKLKEAAPIPPGTVQIAQRGDIGKCEFPTDWADIHAGTLREVESIQTLMGGTVRHDDDASKTLFEIEAPGKRYIHLATHGYTSACAIRSRSFSPAGGSHEYLVDPLTNSFLLFAGALYTGKKGTDDGYLTPLEVMGINLQDAELVVLSACQTGLGKIGGAEGVFGLRRAFMVAGASNLIVSEWEVPNEETEELFTSFYSSLKQGESISKAFRDAEIHEIETVRKRYGVPHPFFWSAFVHVGR